MYSDVCYTEHHKGWADGPPAEQELLLLLAKTLGLDTVESFPTLIRAGESLATGCLMDREQS